MTPLWIVSTSRIDASVVMAGGDRIRHADQPRKAGRGIAMIGALRVVRQQIRQMLGADHGTPAAAAAHTAALPSQPIPAWMWTRSGASRCSQRVSAP